MNSLQHKPFEFLFMMQIQNAQAKHQTEDQIPKHVAETQIQVQEYQASPQDVSKDLQMAAPEISEPFQKKRRPTISDEPRGDLGTSDELSEVTEMMATLVTMDKGQKRSMKTCNGLQRINSRARRTLEWLDGHYVQKQFDLLIEATKMSSHLAHEHPAEAEFQTTWCTDL